MSQWQVSPADPTVAALDVNTVYLLLGIYGWEYALSLDVEYRIIRGRLSFHWPQVPYIVGRACLLVFLIAVAVGTSPLSVDIMCLTNMLLITLSGAVSLGCSSTIFMIRTWMIWKHSRSVCVLLLLLSLGQWSMLIIEAAMVKAINVDGICAVYINSPQVPAAAFIYTTCYDLLVFALSVVGLSTQRSESPLKKRLLAQGILYSAVTGIAYIPLMVSALLNTSLITIFSNIAVTVSTIASSRAMRSLLSLDTSKSSRTPENDHDIDIALTTHIVVQTSMTREGANSGGRQNVDEADKC